MTLMTNGAPTTSDDAAAVVHASSRRQQGTVPRPSSRAPVATTMPTMKTMTSTRRHGDAPPSVVLKKTKSYFDPP